MTKAYRWNKSGVKSEEMVTVHAADSQELYGCDSKLQELYYATRDEFRLTFPGYDLKITSGYRSPEQQFELFKKGRKLTPGAGGATWKKGGSGRVVTNCDGYVAMSSHNFFPSKAIDVCVLDKRRRAVWKPITFYTKLMTIAESVGLKCGGRWKMKDYGHLYLP